MVQDSIPKINAALLRKHETKAANIRADMSLTDKERAAKLKKAKCAVFEMPTAAKWFAGCNLLDAVFKYNNDPDYRAGHSHVMQNAVSDCCEAWSGFGLLREPEKVFPDIRAHRKAEDPRIQEVRRPQDSRLQ